MRTRSTIIYAILALLLIGSSYGWAFEVSKSSTGATIKWANPNTSYYVNASGVSVTSDSVINAVVAAMNEWTNVPTSSFEFFYGGTTSNTYGYNSMNTVSFRNMGGGSVLAVNGFWYVPSTGEMIESDIEFNTYYTYAANGAAGAFDIQNIATHEFGHSLSLKDLYSGADSEKTMYGYASSGETKKISLHQDDIDGISFLYPSSTPVCNYAISSSSASFGASGGTSSITVTTSAGCNWTVANSVPWITVASGGSGSQSGVVTYSVAQNVDASQRSSSITVAGKTFTVMQDGNSNDPTNNQTSGISIDKSSLEFGDVRTRTSAIGTVVVTNNASTSVRVSISTTGSNVSDFRTRLSSRSLNPGASATITVTFRPRTVGDKSANIVVTTNNQSIQPQNVSLTGRGVSN